MISYLDMARARTYEYLDYSLFPRKYVDVRYGDIEREKLDIFLPSEGEGTFPVILQVTGGGFIYGDKSMKKMQGTFSTIVENGFALVSMNYSLSDFEKYPVPIWQVKRAIRFLRTHSEEYSLDTSNLFLYGNSAGGYLVMMTALTDERDPYFNGDESNGRAGDLSVDTHVSGVATIYGVTGFDGNEEKLLAVGLEPRYIEKGMESAVGFFLGKDPDKSPELAAQANVLNHIRPDHPPIVIQHGRDDHTVSPLHSYMLAEAILRVGGAPIMTCYYDGLDHSDKYFKSAENTTKILDFFRQFIR